MTIARNGLLSFAVAVAFFFAAMLQARNGAVYIALGVVFLILSTNFNKKKIEN